MFDGPEPMLPPPAPIIPSGYELLGSLQEGGRLVTAIRLLVEVASTVEDITDGEREALAFVSEWAEGFDTILMFSALDEIRSTADGLEGLQ